MARKKAILVDKPRPRRKPSKKPGKSGAGGFFHFVTSTPVRQLILVAIFLALLFWQLPNIAVAGASLTRLFDWGLILMAIAIGILVISIVQGKFASLIFHLNRWLGGAAFFLAIWGILGFLELGGDFGKSIISYRAPEIIGVLRILGLVVIGIMLIAPRACFRLLASIILWFGEQFKRRPAPSRPGIRCVRRPHR